MHLSYIVYSSSCAKCALRFTVRERYRVIPRPLETHFFSGWQELELHARAVAQNASCQRTGDPDRTPCSLKCDLNSFYL